MVLIQKPGLRGDLVFILKMVAAALVSLLFAVVWYGTIGWAMVWSVIRVVKLLF